MTSTAERFTPVLDSHVDRRILDLPGDRSMAFAQAGDGPDCLAIHGTLVTLEDPWLGIVPALAEHFRVTVVDRPGHGFSRRRRSIDASPWRQAELLHDLAAAAGLRRPVLVGHSYGGTVALAYAMLYPKDTGGVIALAPVCLPEFRIEALLFGPRSVPLLGNRIASALGFTVDPILLRVLWQAMFLPQAMPAHFAAAFPFPLAAKLEKMVAEGEDALALPPALATMATRYAACHVPTRIFGGTADPVVNNAFHGRLAAILMPEATFSWVEGIGHMLHHFAQDVIVEAARSLAA